MSETAIRKTFFRQISQLKGEASQSPPDINKVISTTSKHYCNNIIITVMFVYNYY